MPRIDVHYHLFPLDVLPPSPMLTRMSEMPAVKNWDPARAADILGAEGITTAVLSLPGHDQYPSEREALRRAVRMTNDYFAKLRQDKKDLFGLFANLPPLHDVDGALAEIAYALDTLKAEGMATVTSFKDGSHEMWLGDPMFAPVWEELNRRRAVVFVHPTLACSCAAPPHMSIELPLDTARATFSLWRAGAFDRWPDIRFIFSHAGGPVPMLIARFNTLGRPGPDGTILRDADVQIGRYWFETAQAASVPSLAALLTFADHGRILFGSDTPLGSPAGLQAQALAAAVKDKRLARAIEYDNAVALMPSLRRA
jgi:predicted TIM-barrel fold metal-dependent hydrolase